MYLHSTEYKFQHIYDVKTLKDYCDYAERDIKRAQEVIEKVREYQRGLFDHFQKVIDTPKKNVVTLGRRENYSTKKIEYYVTVEERPITEQQHVNGQTVYGVYKDQKKFDGTDRHKAIKYADEMAKKHRCEIEKTGRWSK